MKRKPSKKAMPATEPADDVMRARDLTLRYMEEVDGVLITYVICHRVWDARRFMESRVSRLQEKGGDVEVFNSKEH